MKPTQQIVHLDHRPVIVQLKIDLLESFYLPKLIRELPFWWYKASYSATQSVASCPVGPMTGRPVQVWSSLLPGPASIHHRLIWSQSGSCQASLHYISTQRIRQVSPGNRLAEVWFIWLVQDSTQPSWIYLAKKVRSNAGTPRDRGQPAHATAQAKDRQ